MLERAADPKKLDWKIPAIIVTLTALLFAAFEIFEKTVLYAAAPKLIEVAHILRGVGSTILVSSVVVWYLKYRKIGVFPSRSERMREADEVHAQAHWLIQLRWLACIFVMGTIGISASLGLIEPSSAVSLWTAAGGMIVFNTMLEFRWRVRTTTLLVLGLQLGVDSFFLTLLLHFSGGVENPFVLLYLFHTQTAAILLPAVGAVALAAWSAGLFLSLGFGEWIGILGHHPLRIFEHAAGEACPALLPAFVVSLSAAYLLVHAGTTSFSLMVMTRLRGDRQRMLAAERLSTVGRIVGLIAHEVNNPLGVITTKAQLALSRPATLGDAEKMRKTLETILRNGERIVGIVRSLLTIGIASSGTREGISVDEIIHETAARLAGRFQTGGVELVQRVQGQLRISEGRYSEISQIFSLLFINALEVTPAGGRVVVTGERRGSVVEVSVIDGGDPLDEDESANLLRPFYVSKSKRGGGGLDLALCKSIARTHGGDLRVANYPGRGARFELTFPGEES